MDGLSFEKLVKVAGKGNTRSGHNYTYTDTRPIGETSYYRLLQVDIDGNTVDNGVRVLHWNLNGSLSVSLYPNPSSGNFSFEFPVGTDFLEVTDISGKVISRVQLGRQQSSYQLNISTWPIGTYFFRFKTMQGWITKKGIKY